MGKLWIRISLVVAVAFALTLSLAILRRRSAHWPDGVQIAWVTFMSPGLLGTRFISAHVNINNIYLWLPTDSTIDLQSFTQIVEWWLGITCNTLFYGASFWLFSMFIAETRQRATPSAKSSSRSITVRLLLSAAIALLLGTAAVFLELGGTCWSGGTACPEYSPTRVWIGFLLAPPMFLTQPSFFQAAGNFSQFNPALLTFGSAGLWAYCFGMISAARLVILRFRVSKARATSKSGAEP